MERLALISTLSVTPGPRRSLNTFLAVGLLVLPLKAERSVRPTSSGGRAAVVVTSDVPVAGIQFTLRGEGGAAFGDVQVAGELDQAAWMVAWHQIDAGEVRVVLMSRSPSVTHTGIMTVLSASVEGGDEPIVTVRDVVASDGHGRLVPMEGGEIRWAAEPVSAVAAMGNHPNPFNPSTLISYTLMRSGHVHLAVYDLLGREVSLLVDGWQEAGRHAVAWDLTGKRAASGVYIARVSSAGSTAIHRMTVMQ